VEPGEGRLWKCLIGYLLVYIAVDVSLGVAHDDWVLHHVLARKNVATGILAVGALITGYGLLSAYLRARYDERVGQWIRRVAKNAWRTLRRALRALRTLRRVTMSASFRGAPTTASVPVGGAAPTVYTQFVFNPTSSLSDEVARLVDVVNDHSREGAERDRLIGGLRHDLNQAQLATTTLGQQLADRIEAEIKELNDKLNKKQVLDLRWAIGGLFITFIGILCGIGT
jgi:hypothetical protein